MVRLWVVVIMLLTVLIFLLFYLGLDVKHAVFGVEAAMIVEFAGRHLLQLDHQRLLGHPSSSTDVAPRCRI